MLEVDGIEIDDAALFALAHSCEPERFGPRCTCCRTYEVCVGAEELPLLDGCVANATACGLLGSGTHSPFEELDDGEYCLDTDEAGLCVMAIPQPNGSAYCALHSAAMQQGLAPYRHKPRACTMWPVASSEGANPMLSITPDTLDFPCNRARRGTPKRLHAGIAEIIDALYGVDFRQRLEAARTESLSAAS